MVKAVQQAAQTVRHARNALSPRGIKPDGLPDGRLAPAQFVDRTAVAQPIGGYTDLGPNPMQTLRAPSRAAANTAGAVEQTSVAGKVADNALGVASAGVGVLGIGSMVGQGGNWLLTGASKLTGGLGFTMTSWHLKQASFKTQRALNNEFGTVMGKIPGSGVVAKVIGAVNAGFANTVGFVTNKTGFAGWRARKNAAKADGLLQGLGEYSHAELPVMLRERARDINAAIAARNVDGFHAAKEALGRASESLTLTGEQSAAVAKLGAHIEKAEKGLAAHARAGAYKNVSGTLKTLPKVVGNTKVLEGAMHTAYIGGSALSAFGEVRGFTKNLASLKQLHKDITGEDRSTFSLLFGKNVPEPVVIARRHLLTSFSVSEVLHGANLGMGIRSALGRSQPAHLAFFGLMAAEKAADTFLGHSYLQHYTPMCAAYAAGQRLPADAYAELIGAASEKLRHHGGPQGAFARAIAEKLAAANTDPKAVMRMIATPGAMDKMVAEVTAENEARKAAAKAAAPAVEGKHVAALKNGHHKPAAVKKDAQVVVGKHTGDVAAERTAPEAAQQLS